tara:strand:+ start:148 stop:558 length:411 start_codon:yes stop_codon:yes gene_type:complete
MFNIFKSIKKDKKSIRDFAYVFSFIFLAISGYLYLHGRDTFITLLILGFSFIVLGLTFPNLLKPLYYPWMVFGIILGWIMTRLILCLMYYFILTPTSIIARLFGKDFLGLKNFKHQSTYWNNRNEKPKSDNYLRQF